MGRNLDVVIVDDEKQITDLLEAFILQVDSSMRINTFTDSVLAKDRIVNFPVDILITDYIMPKISGLQLLEFTPMHVIKILLSGHTFDMGEETLKKRNINFFTKPDGLIQIPEFIAGLSL